MAATPFAANHASIPTATVIEFDDCLTDPYGCGSVEVVAFAIGHQKRNKPRGNFLLGNDDEQYGYVYVLTTYCSMRSMP